MPTIGWFEILLIVAISIIVVGPKDIQSEVTNFEDQANKTINPDIKKNPDKKND